MNSRDDVMEMAKGQFAIRFCSGCQKKRSDIETFFLQPLMPQFRNSEYYYEKGINGRCTHILV